MLEQSKSAGTFCVPSRSHSQPLHCAPQAPWPSGCQLSSANGEHQQESEGWSRKSSGACIPQLLPTWITSVCGFSLPFLGSGTYSSSCPLSLRDHDNSIPRPPLLPLSDHMQSPWLVILNCAHSFLKSHCFCQERMTGDGSHICQDTGRRPLSTLAPHTY